MSMINMTFNMCTKKSMYVIQITQVGGEQEKKNSKFATYPSLINISVYFFLQCIAMSMFYWNYDKKNEEEREKK